MRRTSNDPAALVAICTRNRWILLRMARWSARTTWSDRGPANPSQDLPGTQCARAIPVLCQRAWEECANDSADDRRLEMCQDTSTVRQHHNGLDSWESGTTGASCAFAAAAGDAVVEGSVHPSLRYCTRIWGKPYLQPGFAEQGFREHLVCACAPHPCPKLLSML